MIDSRFRAELLVMKSEPVPEQAGVSRTIVALVVATGLASVTSQLVFVRELMTQFQGNEIVVALVIFLWLLLGGCGSLLAGLCRWESPALLASLSLLLPPLALFQLAAIRIGRGLLAPAGVSVGFYPVFFFSLATLMFYALAVGFVLPYSLIVLRRTRAAFPDVRVYLADNLGDLAGAALFGFWLVFWTTPAQALVLVHLPLALICLWMLGKKGWPAAFLLTVAWVLAMLAVPARMASLSGDVLAVSESPYGRVAVVRHAQQVTMVLDGRPVTSTHDLVGAEEAVHYAMSQVGRGARVMVVCALAGMMDQLAKYEPRRVDLVELDPVVLKWQSEYGFVKDYPWLHRIRDDGRHLLRKTSARYDAILVNLSEPDTFQANRFFTLEFFQAAAGHLGKDGVLGFAINVGGNYYSEVEKKMVACLYATAGQVFDNVLVFAGRQLYFVCSARPLHFHVPRRLEGKGVTTAWVGPYFYGNVDLRSKELDTWLATRPLLNSDRHPVLMRLVLERWYAKFGGFPRAFFLALVLAVAGLVLATNPAQKVIAATGFVVMGAEIWIIMAFQIFHGNLYLKVGVIVTMFLAGLFPGALFASRLDRPLGWLMVSDLVLATVLALVGGTVALTGAGLPEVFFYFAGLAVSLLAGFQFPLAFRITGSTRRQAAALFAVDVLAASVGTLATSLVLVVYLGLLPAMSVLVALKIAGLLMMGRRYGFKGQKTFFTG